MNTEKQDDLGSSETIEDVKTNYRLVALFCCVLAFGLGMLSHSCMCDWNYGSCKCCAEEK